MGVVGPRFIEGPPFMALKEGVLDKPLRLYTLWKAAESMSVQPDASVPQEQPFSALETEKINPATSEIDRKSPLEIVQVINYYVGIDGGASKTLAVVVDAQGHERGRGLAGNANHNAVGLEQAVAHIGVAVEEAMRTAGCHLPLHAAWLGIAGIDRPADYAMLFPHIRYLAEVVHLTNDAELPLSALDGATGVALIAGTGSIALGRDPHGTTARVGGWGHIIGDEGSGYEIGRLGLQAAVRAADGRGQATALLELILQQWHLEKASDIIGQIYPAGDKAVIAQLSPLVLMAARTGDRVASKIVEQAAGELALAVLTVSNILDFPSQLVPLALAGGLLVHETDFRSRVLRRIRRQRLIGQVAIVEHPALSAAHAAVHLAQRDE
jgi:glucosamine kinase